MAVLRERGHDLVMHSAPSPVIRAGSTACLLQRQAVNATLSEPLPSAAEVEKTCSGWMQEVYPTVMEGIKSVLGTYKRAQVCGKSGMTGELSSTRGGHCGEASKQIGIPFFSGAWMKIENRFCGRLPRSRVAQWLARWAHNP